MNATIAQLLLFAQAEQDPGVESARRALNKWQWPARYPWYDSAHDTVARIDVSEPWYAKWNLDWLRDWLDLGGFRLFSMSSFQWVAWLVIAVLIGVVVYLLFRAYRQSEQRTAARTSPGDSVADEQRRVEALPLEGRKRSDFLTEAVRSYQEGNYAEAIIYLFSHQLVELDKHELIHLAKGKTNRQYLRELSRRLPLRRLMEQTTVVFEDVFFGHHPLDRLRFETCWSRLNEFNTLVEGAGE